MKKIAILGSTGSIGTQTLQVCSANRDEYSVVALTANSNVELLYQQIVEFSPKLAVMTDKTAAIDLAKRCRENNIRTEIASGSDGLLAVATMSDVDIVVAAMVGFAGLQPVLAAISAGKDIALANKETLVAAGHIVMPAVKKHKVNLLPVDSEHSAIFQSLQGNDYRAISKVILTASGGPFYGYNTEKLRNVTMSDVLKHPNWVMGNKITVDSATMANKGLEVIEAHWLFDVEYKNIEILVHRQSIVHSLVEYVDGSVIAQLGLPDMKLPIQYALSYPQRLATSYSNLNLAQIGGLSFAKPDDKNFPMLALATAAGENGGLWPCVFNAANEEAVYAFLRKEISFLAITEVCDQVLQKFKADGDDSLAGVFAADKKAREICLCEIEKYNS